MALIELRVSEQYGVELMGIRRGYNGLLGKSENELDDISKLRSETVLDILDMRGTYLRTARCKEFFLEDVLDKVAHDLKYKHRIDGLVIIGKASAGEWGLPDLVRSHNGHRWAIVRLILVGLALASDWRADLPAYLGIVFAAGILVFA